jgi:hypothetical protein
MSTQRKWRSVPNVVITHDSRQRKRERERARERQRQREEERESESERERERARKTEKERVFKNTHTYPIYTIAFRTLIHQDRNTGKALSFFLTSHRKKTQHGLNQS